LLDSDDRIRPSKISYTRVLGRAKNGEIYEANRSLSCTITTTTTTNTTTNTAIVIILLFHIY